MTPRSNIFLLMHLFALGLLASASASLAAKRSDVDVVTTGRYHVANCEGNSTLIVNLLDKLYQTLLPVIEDAGLPKASTAYTAFFKDRSYRTLVSTLFTNVTTGVPMSAPAPYSSDGGITFFCVTAPDQFLYYQDNEPRDAYTDCLDNPRRTATYYAFEPATQYINLCPSFFASRVPSVPPPSTCLTVIKSINRFRGNGQSVWLFKMWIMLEMIAHYYLYTSSGNAMADTTITDDVNKCFRLDAAQSSLNALNYVYYAASVYGDCNAFPNAAARDRGILEVDWADPSDNGSDASDPGVVTVSATGLKIGAENVTVTP